MGIRNWIPVLPLFAEEDPYVFTPTIREKDCELEELAVERIHILIYDQTRSLACHDLIDRIRHRSHHCKTPGSSAA